MDKTIAALLGAAAALTTLSAPHAASAEPAAPPATTSYADLLQPVPNALALQKAEDVRRAETPPDGEVRLAQAYVVRDRRHHHHHHHSHFRVGPLVIGGHHRHHHHHHHHHAYRR